MGYGCGRAPAAGLAAVDVADEQASDSDDDVELPAFEDLSPFEEDLSD